MHAAVFGIVLPLRPILDTMPVSGAWVSLLASLEMQCCVSAFSGGVCLFMYPQHITYKTFMLSKKTDADTTFH